MTDIKALLEFPLFEVGLFKFSVWNILLLLILYISSRLVVKLVKMLVSKSFGDKEIVDEGQQFIITQMAKYAIYTLTALLAIKSLGIDISILLAGSAAFALGIGMGLQGLINDMLSGFILLFEGGVHVGDIVEIQGNVGTVEKIHIRTSKIKSRDGIVIIVPNSKLVSDNVINWSYSDKITRFKIKVGVAYGSDTSLVKQLLIESATENENVSSEREALVRFDDFGDSSLNFELYFWTEKTQEIQWITSDLRFAIDKKFRDNRITIPFPQRDIHILKDL